MNAKRLRGMFSNWGADECSSQVAEISIIVMKLQGLQKSLPITLDPCQKKNKKRIKFVGKM